MMGQHDRSEALYSERDDEFVGAAYNRSSIPKTDHFYVRASLRFQLVTRSHTPVDGARYQEQRCRAYTRPPLTPSLEF